MGDLLIGSDQGRLERAAYGSAASQSSTLSTASPRN